MEAAQTLKEHGYCIVPGSRDIAALIDTGIPDLDPEIMKNDSINPRWDEFMGLSKTLFDSGSIYETDGWFIDIEGKQKDIFGFITVTDVYTSRILNNKDNDWAICTPPFKIVANYDTGIMVNKNSPNKELLGPLIEWITLDFSKTGLQYSMVSGTYDEQQKLSVTSGTLLKTVDSKREILGGQNINPIVYDILHAPDGRQDDHLYRSSVLPEFLSETDAYAKGEKDKATAIADFMRNAGLSVKTPEPEVE